MLRTLRNTMDMTISFPGGKKVNASFDGFVVQTDQSVNDGGTGSAPEPFALFLSSIGTCTGIYVLRFCEQRNIPTEGLTLTLRPEWNDGGLIESIAIVINAPKDFPRKYEGAVLKAASLCTVKRHLDEPPKIEISLERVP